MQMQNAECRMQNEKRGRSGFLNFAFCILHFAFVFAFPLPVAAHDIDTLITGGTIVTMAGPNIENGSIAIDKGAILAVGPSSENDAK